ncbi:signal peptidase II [Nocardioides alcanivorans]|uniref:signal peptidase II n=1 Tax=Nocardioides alcanivorans TaxID=2897352 RepID=UPI001F15AF37|nr:signal peptidase II [Nocardioides alcanivorans]
MQAARGAPLSSSGRSSPSRPGDRRTSRLLLWAVTVVLLVVDQTTKHLAETHLVIGETKPILGDLLGLRLVYNPGAAFSMGTSATELLTGFACIAAIVVLVLSFRVSSRLWAVGLGFLLAGIAGNLTDRLFREPGFFRGHVVDFLALPNFPVFNVADMCINVAAFVIIVQAVRGIRLDGSREAAEEKTTELPGSNDE